ncbi:MAG: hypothetical protein HFI26_15850 [Lachnospiraceae bacterium]|nr:hypothetical protein [Lachnospiraceae bacterium]
MVAQYVVAAPKVENINFGWLSSGKLVAPKEDNIHSIMPAAAAGSVRRSTADLCMRRIAA